MYLHDEGITKPFKLQISTSSILETSVIFNLLANRNYTDTPIPYIYSNNIHTYDNGKDGRSDSISVELILNIDPSSLYYRGKIEVNLRFTNGSLFAKFVFDYNFSIDAIETIIAFKLEDSIISSNFYLEIILYDSSGRYCDMINSIEFYLNEADAGNPFLSTILIIIGGLALVISGVIIVRKKT